MPLNLFIWIMPFLLIHSNISHQKPLPSRCLSFDVLKIPFLDSFYFGLQNSKVAFPPRYIKKYGNISVGKAVIKRYGYNSKRKDESYEVNLCNFFLEDYIKSQQIIFLQGVCGLSNGA